MWSIELPDGSEYELSVANGIAVMAVMGAGMPPIANIHTNYGLADGSLWQRASVRPRLITFRLDAIGGSWAGLHNIRAALIAATNPHRGSLPVKIWYKGRPAAPIYLNAYYDAGLDGGATDGFVEKSIGLRFIATDPFWYSDADASGALTVRQALSPVNSIALRDSAGAWDSLDGGVVGGIIAGTIFALRYIGDDLYAGGVFNSAGGVAAANIARWDGEGWSPLGAGTNGDVLALALGPDGKLYAGGAFTHAGGGAAQRVAVWDGSDWAALGAGVDGTVQALTIGPDGKLYAGGQFTTAGGLTANRIAVWDGSTWGALGSGMNGSVLALAIGPDGKLYAGGQFTTAGGLTANRIAVWDGSTWGALGAGMDGDVRALAFGPDGTLYAGGEFTTADGVAAVNVARWNGVRWQAMGNGLAGVIATLMVDSAGRLLAGGYVDFFNPQPILSWAIWADPVWLAGDGNPVSETTSIYALAEHDGDLVIGGAFVGEAGTELSFPALNTITNPGSARAFPVITLEGPGRLYHLINYATGQRLDFDLTLLDGETVTLDLRPGVKTFTSSFRGNLISKIIAGNLVQWHLNPGDNYVAVWIDDATATGAYTFTPRYWSSDGAVTP